MKNYKIGLLMLFLFTSCIAQKSNFNEETIKILNLVLSEFDTPSCIEKNTFFEHHEIKPDYLIGHYFRVYSYSVMDKNDSIKENNVAYQIFLKDVDGVISKKELEELKKKHLNWNKKEWNTSELLNSKNILVSNPEIEPKCQGNNLIKISEPIFTSDSNKAMVLIKKMKNNTGSTFMKILKKEKGNWIIKGGIPIGTIN